MSSSSQIDISVRPHENKVVRNLEQYMLSNPRNIIKWSQHVIKRIFIKLIIIIICLLYTKDQVIEIKNKIINYRDKLKGLESIILYKACAFCLIIFDEKFINNYERQRSKKMLYYAKKGLFAKALKVCRKELRVTKNDAFFLGMQASLVIRLMGWTESLHHWNDYWCKNKKDDLFNKRENLYSHVPLAKKFDEVDFKNNSRDDRQVRKVCVYTSLFGNCDTLQPVYTGSENIDFICFTDQAISPEGWKVINCKAVYPSSSLCAKEYKILAHKFLEEYDASLFLDASTVIFNDISLLINDFIVNEKFVMYKHPQRNCVYEEGEAILWRLKHNPEHIVKQMEKYKADGMPVGVGLLEASFIWRHHNDQKLKDFMEHWWKEITETSLRDQLSLSYIMWKTEVRPKILPPEFGTSRINPYYFKKPHNSAAKPEIHIPDNPVLCFLYHEKHKDVASTKMRGEQLVEIINSGSFQAVYKCDIDVCNKCIFLTKGLLKEITIEEISKLKQNNVFIAADLVDGIFRQELYDYIDIFIASSIRSYYKLLIECKDKWVFMVSHHVDTRNKQKVNPIDKLRAGYFGELINTKNHEELSDLVDFHHINTKTSCSKWLDDIPDYNLHYAVRNKRLIDGDKPFLKGFTAAYYGANIIVQRNEGDASFYLPPDYPYYIENDDIKSVKACLAKASEDFGGSRWLYGCQVMKNVRHRSSQTQVLMDVSIMMRFLKNLY